MGGSSMALQNTWNQLGVQPGNSGTHWNAASFNNNANLFGQAGNTSGWNMPNYGGNASGQWSSNFSNPADKYGEILQGYKDRYTRNVGALDQLGAVQQQNITTGFNNQASAQQQDLTGRGLAGTTVLDTMKTGNETAKQGALAEAAANLAAQKGQLDAGLSGDQLAFMERYKPMNASSQGSGSSDYGGSGGDGSNAQGLAQMSSLLPKIVGGGTGNWSDDIMAGASRRPAGARGGMSFGDQVGAGINKALKR